MRAEEPTRHGEVARQHPNTANEGTESVAAVYVVCSIRRTEGRRAMLCTIDPGDFLSQRASLALTQ